MSTIVHKCKAWFPFFMQTIVSIAHIYALILCKTGPKAPFLSTFMNLSERITTLRKQKGLSQTDLAKATSVSREIIGRYERGEAMPSIEVAKKIADTFGVSLDYLAGEGINASFDKKSLTRLQDIEKLDADTKEKIYFVIDNIIQNVKAKKAFAS
jgi:transcriptional regulator with XRE-family HTH domain